MPLWHPRPHLVFREYLATRSAGKLTALRAFGVGMQTQVGQQKRFVGEVMRIERRFTRAGQDAYNGIEFKTTTSEIRNPDGKRVFHLPDIEVPAEWSQVACDIIAQKYFRKAGVPRKLKPVAEVDVPPWLWRRTADDAALAELMPDRRVGSETSAKQVFDRLAGTWAYWGWKGGYFDQEQ